MNLDNKLNRLKKFKKNLENPTIEENNYSENFFSQSVEQLVNTLIIMFEYFKNNNIEINVEDSSKDFKRILFIQSVPKDTLKNKPNKKYLKLNYLKTEKKFWIKDEKIRNLIIKSFKISLFENKMQQVKEIAKQRLLCELVGKTNFDKRNLIFDFETNYYQLKKFSISYAKISEFKFYLKQQEFK